MWTAKYGPTTRTPTRSIDSTSPPVNMRILASSKFPAQSARSTPTGFRRTARTTSICWSSAPITSAASTPRPRSSKSTRPQPKAPGPVAAGSTPRTVYGSQNTAPTASACSTPKRRRSRNGDFPYLGALLTTSFLIRTAKCGSAPCGPTASRVSIPRPASSRIIFSPVKPTSGACSSTTRLHR